VKWVSHLDVYYKQSQPWELGTLTGPSQKRNDFNNCGPFAFWVLHTLKQGRALIKGSILNPLEVIDPLEVRMWLLRRLQDAPRKGQVTTGALTDMLQKEQEASPIESKASPSSSQSDPESPSYRKNRKKKTAT
jgi:hypothetical protein